MTNKAPLLALACVLVSSLAVQGQNLRLNVAGSDTVLRTSLTAASLLYSVKSQGNEAAQDYVAAARADYRRLLTGLYASGYYGGTVSILIDGREASSIDLLDAPPTISQIDIVIVPGPKFNFGTASVAPLAQGTALPAEFATGQTAGSETIRAALQAGIEAWRDVGHAKAAADGQQIIARHTDAELDVALTIDPGPRLTFGALSVAGNTDVREDRIRAIAGLPVGRVYSPEELERSAARLRRTGAFSSVKLTEAEAIGANDTLDIIAQVSEDKPRRIGYGIELSSVEGLSLSSYWMHRNLLGGAERLRVDGAVTGLGGETGGIDYRLAASFLRPSTFHVDTDLFARVQARHDAEPNYTLNLFETEVGLTRLIGNDLTLSAGVGFTIAETETSTQSFNYSILTLPVTALLDRRDDPLDSASGYFINLEATHYLALAGAESGARLFADGRIYRSFGEAQNVTLALRGQIGSVVGPEIATAPTDYLFYSGGGNTVRGQSYQSLGIVNGPNTTGGLSIAVLSAEARVDVSEKFGAVAFYDVGYVGADAVPLQNGDWHSGAGLGVRYKTGIGPIRFDIATPADGPEAGKSINFYIGIGQSF